MPTATNYFYSALAQLVEQLTVNQRVVGSSPTGGATFLFINQRVGGMEYGVALVRSDSGKHKVSVEIDLGALEDSFLPYSEMTRRQEVTPLPTYIN